MISLVDIFPTVLALSGVPSPPAVQGRSLVPLLRNESGWVERPVYSETYFPRLHYGWSELRSIQERRYKFIDSSEPELFDIEHDAAESRNLLEKRPELLPAMRQRLEVLVAGLEKGAKSATQQSDPETVAKLASLGYLTASPGALEGDPKDLPSPRRKLVIHNSLTAAKEQAADGDLKLAEASLRKALKEDPRIIDAYSALGNLCLKQKRAKEAVELFLQALQLRPGDPLLVVGLGSSLIRDGKPDEAESVLRKALVTVPDDARIFFLLGSIEENRNEPSKALPLFEKTLALNPKSAPAESELAGMYWRLKDMVKAREHAQKAIALDPGIEGAHLTLGRILESQGENDKAMAEYAEETRLGSENFRAQYEYANMNLKLGHRAEAEEALEKTIELNPAFPPAYLYLAKSYLDDGNRYPRAIELTEKALKLTLTPKDKAFAYFLLADLYNRTGDAARSKQFAQRGAAIGS
jgi:tetratricopeptide (TPR) repeat protein